METGTQNISVMMSRKEVFDRADELGCTTEELFDSALRSIGGKATCTSTTAGNLFILDISRKKSKDDHFVLYFRNQLDRIGIHTCFSEDNCRH